MFLTVGAFVVAIVLLESGGLENWADRLEPGPLRSFAQPVVSALNLGSCSRWDLPASATAPSTKLPT